MCGRGGAGEGGFQLAGPLFFFQQSNRHAGERVQRTDVWLRRTRPISLGLGRRAPWRRTTHTQRLRVCHAFSVLDGKDGREGMRTYDVDMYATNSTIVA